MRLVPGWAADAGLEPALDAHGNLWALPPGGGPVATSGSHVDTVPAGGRHDGALGTVLALEAAAALDGRVGVLTCAAEEAPRFAAGTLGSRLLTGALDEAAPADRRAAPAPTPGPPRRRRHARRRGARGVPARARRPPAPARPAAARPPARPRRGPHRAAP